MFFQEAVVDLGQRLGVEVGGGDVEHVLEMVVDLQTPHHRLGVFAGSVGEDQLATGQPLQRVAEGRVIERRTLAFGDPMARPYVIKPIDQGVYTATATNQNGTNTETQGN